MNGRNPAAGAAAAQLSQAWRQQLNAPNVGCIKPSSQSVSQIIMMTTCYG